MVETTDTTAPVTYEVDEVPVIQALTLMFNAPACPDDWWGNNFPEDNDARREFVYQWYQANEMAHSLFSIGWERGVERQPLRLVEADEVNEGEELDEDEAKWHFLFGYLAGQVATYGEWGTPYTKDNDDPFIDEMTAQEHEAHEED